MTYLEAAVQVLGEEGQALHYSDIAARAIERGLITPLGATPEASMASTLYTAAKRPGPAVRTVGRGFFTVEAPPVAGGLEDELAENNLTVRKDLLKFIREMEPRQLEHLVGQLLTELGYEDVQVTQYVGDQGIDVTATLTAGGVASVNTAVQVKRQASSVGGPVVQQLRGSLTADQRGLLITTGSFSPAAKAQATATGMLPISLVEGDEFVDLMISRNVGVTRKSIEVLELDLESLVFPEEEGRGGRSAALWPLPGGQDKYFESLLAFLDAVGEEGIELDAMVAWVIDNYENVTKEKLVGSYLRSVLYSMGLVRFDGEQILLTDLGSELRVQRYESTLLHALVENVLGVEELIAILREDGPAALSPLHAALTQRINRSWETTYQTKFRLLWLRAGGLAAKDGQEWKLASGADELIAALGAPLAS